MPHDASHSGTADDGDGSNLRSLQTLLGHVGPAVNFNPFEELNRTKLRQQQRKLATMTFMLTPSPPSESKMPPRELDREGEMNGAIGSSDAYTRQLPSITIGSTNEIEGDSYTLSGSDTSDCHRSQQFSITALTDSSGTVTDRYVDTAYDYVTFSSVSKTEQKSSAAGNRYTYAAREWDTTLGLHYLPAGWMNGLTAGFLTRDPIGYRSTDINLFRFVFNNSLVLLDPSGLKCTTYIPVIHGYVSHLLDALGNPNVQPEFDKCDRVGVVCCWMSRGKKVCRDFYQGGEPPITKIDPIPPNWPEGDDVIDTRTKEGKDFIEKMFKRVIPDAMKNQCVKNRCNCTKFTAIVLCDENAKKLLELLVNEGRLPNNPCYKKYNWDCKNKSWDNPDGSPIPPEDWKEGDPVWPPHMNPNDYPLD